MNGFVPRFPDLMDVSVTTNKNFNKIQEISHVISLDDDFEAIELNRGFKKQKVNTIKIANAYYSLEEVTDVVNSFVPKSSKLNIRWTSLKSFKCCDGSYLALVSDQGGVQLISATTNDRTKFVVKFMDVISNGITTFWMSIERNGDFVSVSPANNICVQSFAPYIFQLISYRAVNSNQCFYAIKTHLLKFLSLKSQTSKKITTGVSKITTFEKFEFVSELDPRENNQVNSIAVFSSVKAPFKAPQSLVSTKDGSFFNVNALTQKPIEAKIVTNLPIETPKRNRESPPKLNSNLNVHGFSSGSLVSIMLGFDLYLREIQDRNAHFLNKLQVENELNQLSVPPIRFKSAEIYGSENLCLPSINIMLERINAAFVSREIILQSVKFDLFCQVDTSLLAYNNVLGSSHIRNLFLEDAEIIIMEDYELIPNSKIILREENNALQKQMVDQESHSDTVVNVLKKSFNPKNLVNTILKPNIVTSKKFTLDSWRVEISAFSKKDFAFLEQLPFIPEIL